MAQTPQQYGVNRKSRLRALKETAARNREQFSVTNKFNTQFSNGKLKTR